MPALVLLVSSIVLPSASAQTFTPTGSLNVARAGHQATLLVDGHVLVTGGYDASGNAVAQAELFDPGSGTWTLTGRNVFGRLEHTATLLQDGRVLVAGGVGALSACTPAGTAELYDPLTGSWSVTSSLLAPATSGAIAVRLLDGRVLVSGGGNRCGSVSSTASIFDPVTGTWSATASMRVPRQLHSAILLADGRVLVAGGSTSAPFNLVASAEVFNPTLGTWCRLGLPSTFPTAV
jgi:N-acetylneuraminic acid mutarotase